MSKIIFSSLVVALLVGCANHANQQYYTVPGYQMVVSQPQPVVVTQPQVVYTQPRYVVTQPRYVVSRPAQVVVRAPVVYTQPPVMNPARVYVGNVGSYRHCAPGSVRQCEAYCGGGIQTCNYDGMSWGSCVEGSGQYYGYEY
jgi:hypothetical protein